ncbi:glycosyltransferase [Sphingomonas albertensis]|uniref:Glycosyltransferase n=1 Tax=Sphingomonas albertensis TaxID=2762591 RepID=A0ABR7AJ64_9SPHN|nr:glycosyltransferase [Sphingomonas albertensis]MBC3940490.1 glycosyltransferase [Sphingomonas albertensis]
MASPSRTRADDGPPRVLHVCDSIIGGTGSFLAELLTPQAERYGPEVLTLLMPEQHRDHIEPRLLESGIRFEYFDRPNRLLGMAKLFFAYRRVRRQIRPEIVHAHSFGAGVITRLGRFGRWPRMIFCPHGWAFSMQVSPRAKRFIIAVERYLARKADRIILISPHECDVARGVGLPDEKLVVINNAISKTPPPVAPARWDDDRIKLLFVGRFDRQKGLDLLLEAIAGLGDRYALRVVGQPVVAPQIGQITPNFVEYVGWRDRNGVVSEMMAADAIIVPSRWEGFGLVAIEAMRVRRAVIASDAGGLNDTLDAGRFGLTFPSNNVDALRHLLETLDPAGLAEWGERGHARFIEKYTSETMVEAVDATYRDLLATR